MKKIIIILLLVVSIIFLLVGLYVCSAIGIWSHPADVVEITCIWSIRFDSAKGCSRTYFYNKDPSELVKSLQVSGMEFHNAQEGGVVHLDTTNFGLFRIRKWVSVKTTSVGFQGAITYTLIIE